MVPRVSISRLLELSAAERILLVEEIWDSLAHFPDAVALTDAQRRELDARFDTYGQDPATGWSWESVKDRILRSS